MHHQSYPRDGRTYNNHGANGIPCCHAHLLLVSTAAMSSAPPSLPPLDDTFGALFLGCVLACIFYGMTVVQSLYYYTRYHKDAQYLKLLVGLMLALDTMPVALIIHSMYHYFIQNFANPIILTRLVWSILLEVAFAATTALLVQCFYTVRVWRMSRNYFLTGLIFALSLTEFALCVVWLARAMPMKTFEQLKSLSDVTITANAIQAVVDTIIAVSLCFMLHQSRTGFRHTNAIINKLTFFFVNTGLLTSICAIGVVIFSAASPNSLIYAAWYFCIGRLYTNSLLAALNSRDIIHGRVDDIDISMASIHLNRLGGDRTIPGSISVTIDTMTDDNFDRKLAPERSVIANPL